MTSPANRRILTGAVPVVVALAAMWLVPMVFSSYWLFVITGGIIAIPIMQSLGVITGRVGIMSLCQMSFAMLGAWVVGWCHTWGVPGGFWVWMVLGGLAAVPAGLLIGFPALRLRGVNLAIVTFAFATAMDVVFSSKQYPGADNFQFVTRPAGFTSDPNFFRFCIVIVAAIFVGLYYIDRTRIGASWLELRYSERGAAAHGTSVAYSKLAAFGLSAFLAGLGGALLVGQVGSTTPAPFSSQVSLTNFAIAVVIGVRFWDSAVIAGLLGAISPVLLDEIHVPSDYVGVVFGVSAVLVLAKGRGQLGQSEIMRARKQAKQVRALLDARSAAGPGVQAAASVESATDLVDVVSSGDELAAVPAVMPAGLPAAVAAVPVTRPRPPSDAPALELRGVSVRFGAVVAVNDVQISIPRGSVTALIGPNGAGKSTLVNAATGFVPYHGSVLLDGRPMDKLPPHRRARLGLRRSFQQLRVPPTLTVGMFLAVAAGRRLTQKETEEFLDWFGCPPPQVPIGTMDVGSRRMLEVAGLAAGLPPVLLLDEPAAGQGERETRLLSQRISEIPARTGASVLLIEHDVDLIRAACDSLIVMDFGKVIASGEPAAVLAEPKVVEAYLGSTSNTVKPRLQA